ncbi:MAG: phosphoenolpyruvate--protein phosphotransferase [Bauldia sp.]|nr:phosphoenolpyruvate--protein phosphotransferase [Bauldia sp.]
MPQTVERRGRPASPGLAAGPLVRLEAPRQIRTTSGDPASEQAALTAAVAEAVDAIRTLADATGGDAADILEFQVAMLEDEALTGPAYERVAAGTDAAAAWSATLAEQIAGYEAAEDDYFRARAADLRDLRDEVLRRLAGEDELALPEAAVLTGEDVTPTRFLSVDWSRGGGIALSAGSPSSHVAMLARSRGVPMVVGLGELDLSGHEAAIVDAYSGRVILSPADDHWSAYETARAAEAKRAGEEATAAHRPATTAGGERIAVMINVAEPEELDGIDPAICDGIGLVRTEFLFHRGGIPDEETQYRAYRRILEWAAPRPVVLRTLDAGGDKPIAGLTIDDESNPFLGTRGIRLCLARPDVFRVQLRALARAAVHGNARIMLPMVTVPEEIDRAAEQLDAVVAELTAEGVPHARPPLGIMVEVPAVAVVPELFRRAAFFSIGSNDLTQYTTASARDIAAVSGLNDAGHPAVIALIGRVVAAARALGIDVSLCGDMGGDPAHIPALIAAGLRSVSVAPPQVGRAKLAIATAVTP